MSKNTSAAVKVAGGFAVVLVAMATATGVWQWTLATASDGFAEHCRVDAAIAVCFADIEEAVIASRAVERGMLNATTATIDETSDSCNVSLALLGEKAAALKVLAGDTGRPAVAAVSEGLERLAAFKVSTRRQGLVGEMPKVEKKWIAANDSHPASVGLRLDVIEQMTLLLGRDQLADSTAAAAQLQEKVAARSVVAVAVSLVAVVVVAATGAVLIRAAAHRAGPTDPAGPSGSDGEAFSAMDHAWHQIAGAGGAPGEADDGKRESVEAAPMNEKVDHGND